MGAIGFRCPFCHAGVAPSSEPARSCAACFAPHHAECWDEHGRCSACGESAPLAARRSRRLMAAALLAASALGVTATAVAFALPRATRAVEKKSARAWLEDARALVAKGDLEGALAAADRALIAAPRAEYAHRCRALVLRAKGQLAEALAATDRALALDEGSHAAWTLRGALLIDSGQPAEATHPLEVALRIEPASEWARAELVRARSRR